MEHPFFAVTARDGTFSIGGLPPGSYVVEAWHERFGVAMANVTASAAITVDFTFK